MPKEIFSIYKPLGLTPLETLEKFRKREKLSPELKITYAGRLDPLAEGVLLLLCGDKVHEKEKYLNLPKTYTAQILFGISTDTFDLLGKVQKISKTIPEKNTAVYAIKNLKGSIKLHVPMYSSVPLHGKPSFQHARAGTIEAKDTQERIMHVTHVTIGKIKFVSAATLLKTTTKNISRVAGDFRQKEITKLWHKKLKGNTQKFLVVEARIRCASGTYIRSLATYAGKLANTPTLLYHLKRDKVGNYDIKKSHRI